MAIISGFSTYAALNEALPFAHNKNIAFWLLNFDLVLLLSLAMLIAKRMVGLWSGKKRGLAGSHLHVRLVYTFSILAAVPVILMTIFSAFFFHYGVQTWFSQRVQTAIQESQAVAEAYLEEHQQVIKADTLAMANDLNRQVTLLTNNDQAFNQVMETQSTFRNLSEAIVFNANREILARSSLSFLLEFETAPENALREASNGEVILMRGEQDDRIRALVKLRNFDEAYLFVGRMVDPKVLAHLAATKEAAADYADLQSSYSGLQVTVTLIFILIGFLILMAAIWFGLSLAKQLVSPISSLINVADRVRAGDLTATIPEEETFEEFDYLAKSFNRMTKQIYEQQTALIDANRQLDQRRRFTETVLAGVSSGVLVVNEVGNVTLANNSAIQLLEHAEQDLLKSNITEIIPELQNILDLAHSQPNKVTSAEISITQKNSASKRTFLIRVAIELVKEQDTGAIVTFDDITELQSAQRKAAWADVARRIAHEIKNPLTPIHLSAERLRRKYLSQITEGRETFEQCTDTIIRHVEDIGHMVNEFSSFGRMPEPKIKSEDLGRLVRDSLVLQRQAHPDIKFKLSGIKKDTFFSPLDTQQIRQAITNIVQNSVDSIHGRMQKETAKNKATHYIDVTVAKHGSDHVAIIIADSGLGLPQDETPESLTEPYVTHKPKGTGLGLAIVKKIMEDHGGELILDEPDWLSSVSAWKDRKGATVILTLPLDKLTKEKQPKKKVA